MSAERQSPRPFRLSVRVIGTARRDSSNPVEVLHLAAHRVRIGRAPEVAVALPHADVAMVQAEIERRRDGDVFSALAPGCRVAGTDLRVGEIRPLREGDVVELCGRFALEYGCSDSMTATNSSENTASVALALARELLAANDDPAATARPTLIGQTGAASGRAYPVPYPHGRLVLGRGADCDLVLLDPDLSRQHAAIEITPETTVLVDLDSKNGTYCDGGRLPAGTRLTLRHDMEFHIGSCRFRYTDPIANYVHELQFGDAPGPVDSEFMASNRSRAATRRSRLAGAVALLAGLGLVWILGL